MGRMFFEVEDLLNGLIVLFDEFSRMLVHFVHFFFAYFVVAVDVRGVHKVRSHIRDSRI